MLGRIAKSMRGRMTSNILASSQTLVAAPKRYHLITDINICLGLTELTLGSTHSLTTSRKRTPVFAMNTWTRLK